MPMKCDRCAATRGEGWGLCQHKKRMWGSHDFMNCPAFVSEGNEWRGLFYQSVGGWPRAVLHRVVDGAVDGEGFVVGAHLAAPVARLAGVGGDEALDVRGDHGVALFLHRGYYAGFAGGEATEQVGAQEDVAGFGVPGGHAVEEQCGERLVE